MTACETIEPLLAAKRLDVLGPSERALVDEHVAACAACAGFATTVEAALDALRAEAAPPELWGRLRDRLEERAPPRVTLACTYCHAPLERASASFCAGCLAPHHRECFTTHGRCAAPGCGETHVVRPRSGVRDRRKVVLGALVLAIGGAAVAALRAGRDGHDHVPIPTKNVAPVDTTGGLAPPRPAQPPLPVPRRGVVRVLYLEAYPRWEYRHLWRTLERDPHVLFRAHLASAEDATTNPHSKRGKHDPAIEARHPEFFAPLLESPTTLDELGSYDVVILGDVSPVEMPRALVEGLVTFVERGGGLVAIAGETSGLQRWIGTPLERLLAVEPASSSAKPREGAITYVVTDAGRCHEVFAGFGPAPALDRFAGAYWLAGTTALRPGAVALARTTRGDPVFVTREVGKGRTFTSLVDETWRWRGGVGDRDFAALWGRVVRWAAP